MITADKKIYRFERTLGDMPSVSQGEEIIPRLLPGSLLKASYFGQKDLVKFSEKRFAQNLIDKFTAQKSSKEEEIEQIRRRVETRLVTIAQHSSHLEKIDEIKAELAEKKRIAEKI